MFGDSDAESPGAQTPLRAALHYAARGWRVHPLRPTGSAKNRRLPRLPNWQLHASADPAQIARWWAETPDSGVGIATGGAAGLFVLDVDNKNGKNGDAALAALIAKCGDLPATAIASTPSDGRHYYFEGSPEVRNSVSAIGEGLDIRGVGGYVVAPSPADAGRNYSWVNDYPTSTAPSWLLAAAMNANSKTMPEQRIVIAEGTRNATLFREGARLRRGGACASDIAERLRTLPIEGNLDPGEIEGIAASAARYEPEPWAGSEDPCTDLANARRLERQYGHLLLFVEGIGWHVWTKGRGPWLHDELAARRAAQSLGRIVAKEAESLAKWAAAAPDDDVRAARTKAMNRRFAWIGRCESAQGVENALKMAQPLLACKAEELDALPMVLGLPSGVLELDTGRYREHRQADRLTRIAGCDYDPAATCPTWLKFVNEVMCSNPELVDYFQRLIGYSLSGHRGEHLLPIFHGGGANGKSTALGTVQAMLGAYAGTAAPGLLIARNGNEHPTGLADLQGRRLVVVSETGEAGRLNEEQVKALTGGDRISARRMRMDFYQFDPTHLLIMQTNHKPRVVGTDEGIWRRLRLIPFAATIPPEMRDPKLPDKLRAELPGILTWAVDGWRKYLQQGFRTPAVVSAATADYRNSSDQIGSFVSEVCDIGAGLTASASALYRAYCEWCEEAGERPRNQREFGMRLSERGFEASKGTGGARRWRGLSPARASGASGASGSDTGLNAKGGTYVRR